MNPEELTTGDLKSAKTPDEAFFEQYGFRGWRDDAGQVHFRRRLRIGDTFGLAVFLVIGLPFIPVGGWIVFKSAVALLLHPLEPAALVALLLSLVWLAFFNWLLAISVLSNLPITLDFDPQRQMIRWQRVPLRPCEYPLAQLERVEVYTRFVRRSARGCVRLIVSGRSRKRYLGIWWGSEASLTDISAQAERIAQVLSETLDRPVEIVDW